MIIRKYKEKDCEDLAKLFYDTVHCVNCKDYTPKQLNVWATGKVDIAKWKNSFLEHESFVAIEKNKIVGFGDIDNTGYLDRLYVHKDMQGKRIATALCEKLENSVCAQKVMTHASITAKSFFEKRGYVVIKEQRVLREGIALTNYIMEKEK